MASAPHSVAVDLTPLDRQTYQEIDAVTLERGVLVRLVQEGFAVVAPSARPEVTIRVQRKGRGVELAVDERTTLVEVDLKNLREFHMEVAQKAAELARAEADNLDARTIALRPPPPPPIQQPQQELSEAMPPEPRWSVLAASGALLRAPGIDLLVVAAARVTVATRMGLHLESSFSVVTNVPLTAYDGSLLVGPSFDLAHLRTLRLELGLSVGALLHAYAIGLVSANERSGTRLDFLARPFLRLVAMPGKAVLLWAQVGVGLSSRAREHRLLGEVLYARGELWLGLVGGLGWEL